MDNFIQIQEKVFCEPCKDCGARPVIDQLKGGKFLVRCPNDKSHYQTKAGLIDIDDWNLKNRSQSPLGNNTRGKRAS